MKNYTHNEHDRWSWRLANFSDFTHIIDMAHHNAGPDVAEIFEVQPEVAEFNLLNDLTKQAYQPHSAFIVVAEDNATKELLGFSWADVTQTIWSNDLVLNLKIVDVDTPSPRERIRLIAQMMLLWEDFCLRQGVPVICSTSVRRNQGAYTKLHQQMGYAIHGAFFYKRVIARFELPSA
jgi:hypothetical protein